MTVAEARKYFGLKENDTVKAEGLKSLIKSNEDCLKVWSLNDYMRREHETEIEACKVLLGTIQ